MDTSVCKAGKAYSSQAQEMVKNVTDFMRRESAAGSPVIPFNYVQKRVSAATGVSKATYYRIKKRINEGILETPGKKRRPLKRRARLDSFDETALRREILAMYSRKEIPTCNRLKKFLEDNLYYTGSLSTVQRMLHEMGFRWKRQNNRKILLERDDIVAARRAYLREIRKNERSANPYDICYIDETYLHKTETVAKTWQLANPDRKEEAACCLKIPVGKGPRLIIVHCGGAKGWVEGAHRMWRNTNPTSADYHGDMNTENFKDWFEDLCGRLEEPTILVMDNASYHNTVKHKVPNTSTRKKDIQDWLDNEGVRYPEGALKSELLMIAKSVHKDKVYVLDIMALEHGHKVLRLPAYHCDLNPIELVWAQCKAYVRQNNTDFTLASVEKLWLESLEQVTKERWADCVRHVKKIQEEYWEKDGIVEEEIERLIINFGELSSDSSSNDDSGSGEESGDSDHEDLGVMPLEVSD